MPYFDEPVGRVKIQTTSKNIQRCYTPKHLISDLLSKDFSSQNSDLPSSLTFHTARRNETSTNIVRYLYSFRALFVLYEAELDNKSENLRIILMRIIIIITITVLMILIVLAERLPSTNRGQLTKKKLQNLRIISKK